MKNTLIASFLTVCGFAWCDVAQGQWFRQNSGVDSTITGVVMVDTLKTCAVSRSRSILWTTNCGEAWVDLAAPLSSVMPWNAVSFLDSANGIAVGDHGSVFNIVGGSRHFTRQIPYGQNCLSALHLSAAEIYVGGDSGWVYHSIDSGQTWTSEKISEWPIRALVTTAPLFPGGQNYALTPYSICSKSSFPSSGWKENVIPALQGLGSEAYDLVFTNEGTGFIVGVGGDLWASPMILWKEPLDTSWTMVPSGVPGAGALYAVSAPSAEVIFACGAMGMIVKSTDGGSTWSLNSSPVTPLPVPTLRAISFIDEKHGFAVGDAGTILYTSNGGLTGIHEQHPPIARDFVLEQNYPNPFNPSTTISYGLSAASCVTLKVFDIVGREVATLVDGEMRSAGRHMVRWDGTTLTGRQVASGVYFYQLTTGTGTQIKRAVVLR